MTIAIAERIIAGPRILKPHEVRALIAAPDLATRMGKRDAALLAVFTGAGLRLSEACSLRADQVECGPNDVLRIMVKTAKQRDQERWRCITLPTPMARLVRAWLTYAEPRYWLFPGRHGEHLSGSQTKLIVTKYLCQIGRADLHTHSLRHTFGAMVTRSTRSIYVAQKLLGHADPRVTATYYSVFEPSDADAAARDVTAALSRRGRRVA